MAISAQQRDFLTRSLRTAIGKHYGDDVPDLKLYTRQKRATYIDRLKEKLHATVWYTKVAEAKAALSHTVGVDTKLRGNYQVAQGEAHAERDKAMAEVEADYQATLKKLTLKYEPKVLEQQEIVRLAKAALQVVERASYFAALEEEDDGRNLYRQSTFDAAVTQRVDRYIETSLGDDVLGQKVADRIEQEQLVGDVAYISKNVEAMRETLLGFIAAGDVPSITMKAWGIVDGQDVA